MFILRKDGKFLSQHKTESEALTELQRIQSFSFDYAFKFGGYTLKDEKVVSIDPLSHKAVLKSVK
jgi:hypothetical protein